MARHFKSDDFSAFDEDLPTPQPPRTQNARMQNLPSFDDEVGAPAASAYTGATTVSQDQSADYAVGGASARVATAAPATRLDLDNTHSFSRTLSNILLALGIVLLLAAGGIWGYQRWRYHKQDLINEELAAYATVYDDGSRAPIVDWAALKAINPEVVGWVQIPGTVVNYPVFQASDNEKYLTTSAEGDVSLGGQVFLDYENNAPGMLNSQTIIYGHHLKNGSMFKAVSDMDKQQFFDSIDTVWYVTETETYELQPLFVYHTDPYDSEVRRFNFQSDAEFQNYLLNRLQTKGVTQVANAENIISHTTRGLTLSTCNYIDDSGRTELVCVPKSQAAQANAA